MLASRSVVAPRAVRGDRLPLRGRLALPVCLLWLASVLLLDGPGGWAAHIWLVGSGWLVLAVLGRNLTLEQQCQCVAVMAYAAVIEVVFAGGLDTYVYRMGPIAPYVLPGHGVIFLTALALAREPVLVRHARALVLGTVAASVPLAVVGLLGERHDLLGALWAVCFCVFAVRGRWPLLYASIFWIALFLEHAGVGLGAWSWATHDQILGVVAMGNPPSVPGGGYVFLAAGGLWLGSRAADPVGAVISSAGRGRRRTGRAGASLR